MADVQVVGSLISSKSSDNPTKTANRVDLSPLEQCWRSFLVERLTPTPLTPTRKLNVFAYSGKYRALSVLKVLPSECGYR